MIPIDWDTIRVQYELLGVSVESLAEEHNCSVDALVHYIREKRWTRITKTANRSDLSRFADPESASDTPCSLYLADLQETSTAEMEILAIRKQLRMRPQLDKLELSILDKTIKAVNMLDEQDTSSIRLLRMASEIMEKLYSHAGILRKMNSGDRFDKKDDEYESDQFNEEFQNAMDKLYNRNDSSDNVKDIGPSTSDSGKGYSIQ